MDDEHYMREAIRLSLSGSPSPNPYVGAVIVKDGKVISSGYHKRAGMPHAEVEALRSCEDPSGATLYVSLEPCSHHGRTPPCTDVIISSGIKTVIYGMSDPNPQVSGKKALEDAGITVRAGVLADEVLKVNQAFDKSMKTGLPYVTIKSGMTLDGKIATRTGQSKWITGVESRQNVQELRDKNEAILVGINTVLADDPHLTCGLADGRDPLRIILDDRLQVPLDAKVLGDDNVVIVTTKKADPKKIARLKGKADVWVAGDDIVDLDGLMRKLGQKGITTLLVEGGGQVNSSFLMAGLVDKIILFIAPKIMTGRDVCVFAGKGIGSLDEAVDVDITSFEKIGSDIMLTCIPKY
ncbi:bifunctional diaminohydroxyphosphoribosylaminopyrimidine deaminase/5-amino-6-(5-phosphoribosylamino)uracil reductase RibD [Candidatus Altiarchaeota archaeon]